VGKDKQDVILDRIDALKRGETRAQIVRRERTVADASGDVGDHDDAPEDSRP
jgi:hypothetical protein